SQAHDEQRLSGAEVVLLRNERRGRRAQANAKEGGGVARERVDEFAGEAERLRPILESEEEEPKVDERAHRMESELERRDDAKVAAAAPQRPEQIGVLVLRRADDTRVS